MWWRIDKKDIGSINIFKEKIVKGEFLEMDISLYERSQNGSEVYAWECQSMKKVKFGDNIYKDKIIDFFLV